MNTIYWDPQTGKTIDNPTPQYGGGGRYIENYIDPISGHVLTTTRPVSAGGTPDFFANFISSGRPYGTSGESIAIRLRDTLASPDTVIWSGQGRGSYEAAPGSRPMGSVSYGGYLYNKYYATFFQANTSKTISNFSTAVQTYQANASRDYQAFQHQYGATNLTTKQLAFTQTQTLESLKTVTYSATPAKPGKLFGVLPVRVPGVVQNVANLGAIVGGAYGAQALAGVGEAGTVTSPTVSTSLTGSTIEAGSFSADLGIRGAQAVNLASSGGTPGGSVGLTGLQVTTYTVGAAKGLVATAPEALAVTPQALRVGVVGSTIESQNIISQFVESLKNTFRQAVDTAQANPVKTGLGAAGTALTAQKIVSSSNPLEALVNTVSSAVGLGPIIPPTHGGPSPMPPSTQPTTGIPLSGIGGGGSGGGGSFGGSTVFEQTVFPIMGIIFMTMMLALVIRNR